MSFLSLSVCFFSYLWKWSRMSNHSAEPTKTNMRAIEEKKRKKERKILSVQKKGLLLQAIYDRSVAQLV